MNEQLPVNVVCPYCKTELELEEEEQTAGKYTCPNCTKEVTVPKIMNETEKTKNQPVIDRQEELSVESLQKEKDWFIGIEEGGGLTHYYDKEQIVTELRTNILEGKYEKTTSVVIHSKDKDGKWQQSTSTLEEFAKNHFKLRVLYQPVWSHAMAGLKWGAIGGVFLKLADTFLMLLSVDGGMAVLFAVAVGACMIPRIGWIGIAAISYFMFKFSRANFFLWRWPLDW